MTKKEFRLIVSNEDYLILKKVAELLLSPKFEGAEFIIKPKNLIPAEYNSVVKNFLIACLLQRQPPIKDRNVH